MLILQDLNQPKTEIDLPPGILSVPLMRHQVLSCFNVTIYWPLKLVCVQCTEYCCFQKIALAWMFQKETTSLHCSGGILADDQVTYS